MSAIEKLAVTVYRGGGRRYFKKASAYRGAARAIIKAKAQQECGGVYACSRSYEDDCEGYVPEHRLCPYCDFGSKRHLKLRERLARWLRWRDERAVPGKPGRPWNWCHKCRQTVDVDADSCDGSEHRCWGCDRWFTLVAFEGGEWRLFSERQQRTMNDNARKREKAVR